MISTFEAHFHLHAHLTHRTERQISSPPRPRWLAPAGLGQRNVAPELWALRISQLLQFVDACKDTPTWAELQKTSDFISMTDVNKQFVIPWTKGSGNSVSLLMNPEEALRSQLMVSHAWMECAEEVYEALQLFCKRSCVDVTTETFFCTLSIYQANDDAPNGLSIGAQVALNPFKKVIAGLPREGMAVLHTSRADIYSRMWCVHEVDEALDSEISVRGIMSSRYEAVFRGQASHALLGLRTEEARCSFPADEAMLRTMVLSKSGGFQRLDAVILAFRRDMFEKAVRTTSANFHRISYPEDMRAVALGEIIRGFGTVFRSSSDSNSSYSRSQEVGDIDIFISHSQGTTRSSWMKATALMLRLNLITAVAASVLTQLAVHGLEQAGVFKFPDPLVMGYMFGGGSMHPQRFGHQFFFACSVFLMVLLLVPQIPGFSRSRCFLDLCCLHPTDPLRKLQATEQLGGLIQKAKKMVVLWEADYFTKLQCVVEMSAFVATHTCTNSSVNGNFLFVPLKLPTLALALYMYHFLASLIFALITPLVVQSEWHAFWVTQSIPEGAQAFYIYGVYLVFLFCGLYALPAFPLWMFCRAHLSDQRLLSKQLHEFSVEKSVCFLESERQQLLQHITSSFGDIANFERYVQEELPKMVLTSGLPTRIALVGSLSHLFLFWTQASLAYEDGELELFCHFLLTIPLLGLCTDMVALNLILKLADTARAERFSQGSNLMKAGGPLASASLMSLLNATCVVFINPIAPIWAHAVVTLLFLGFTLWLHQRDNHGHPSHVPKPTGATEEVLDYELPVPPERTSITQI